MINLTLDEILQSQVEQIGSPFEIYDKPANVFVAGFLGSPAMNLVKGTLKAGKNPTLTTKSGDEVALPKEAAAYVGREITVGVRPENVELVDKRGLNAKVTVIELTGPDTLLGVEAAGQNFTMVLHRRLDLTVGQPVQIAFQPNGLHFFDSASGSRL